MNDSTGSILITGANGGLGCALTSHIASTPGLRTLHGIYTARNTGSATALDAALRGVRDDSHSSSPAPQGHSFEKVSLDLSRLSSVREVATDIKSRVESGQIPPIRALVLNAGVEEFATQSWTEEGLDLTFATNYLGHWLLALMLLSSMDRESGRIIWISSWSHKYVQHDLGHDVVRTLTTDCNVQVQRTGTTPSTGLTRTKNTKNSSRTTSSPSPKAHGVQPRTTPRAGRQGIADMARLSYVA